SKATSDPDWLCRANCSSDNDWRSEGIALFERFLANQQLDRKLQKPSSNEPGASLTSKLIVIWSLVFLWCLELGFWSFSGSRRLFLFFLFVLRRFGFQKSDDFISGQTDASHQSCAVLPEDKLIGEFDCFSIFLLQLHEQYEALSNGNHLFGCFFVVGIEIERCRELMLLFGDL